MTKNKVYMATIQEVSTATPNYKFGQIMPDPNLRMVSVGTTKVVEDGMYYRDQSTGEFYSGIKECYEVGEHVVTQLTPLPKKHIKRKTL